MSSLDNIPKKTVFSAPDGYFDKLPADIQSRISAPVRNRGLFPLYRYGLQYALPLLIIAVVLFYTTSKTPDAESILATIETKDLVFYFEEVSFTTTEELLDNFEMSAVDVEAIEIEAYSLDMKETADEVWESELNNL